MPPYALPRPPRLTRAARLRCGICDTTLPREERHAHLNAHARDGRYLGVEPIGAVFAAAPAPTAKESPR